MKKLLVVLAVLFATASAYATVTPAEATGTVEVNVICPITITGDDVVTFDDIVMGEVYETADFAPGQETDVDFGIYGCVAGNEEINNLDLDIKINLGFTKNHSENVEIDGAWYYDGTVALADGDIVPFDGSLPIHYAVTEVDASAQTTFPANPLTWTLTVTATPQW